MLYIYFQQPKNMHNQKQTGPAQDAHARVPGNIRVIQKNTAVFFFIKTQDQKQKTEQNNRQYNKNIKPWNALSQKHHQAPPAAF